MSADGARRRLGARFCALRRDARGATAAEFAMVLPVLVAFMFGLWELGWSQHSASTVRLALNQTARELILNPSMDGAAVQARVRDKLDSVGDPAVTVSMSKSADPSGVTLARLTASYPHTFTVPGLGEYAFNYHSTVVTPLP